jgi:hypothetical protein
MTEAPFVAKPNLEETDDVEQAILDYHRAVVEAPVLYEKGQGPQDFDEERGEWTGGDVLSDEEARERDLAPHQCGIDQHDEDDAFDLDHVEALLAGEEDPELHSSRLNRALRWIWPLIGEMPYGWWTSGAVPAGQPAYGENKKLPGRDTLRKRTVFCAGVPNLLLRSVGKRVPTAGNPNYDGGTYAYGVYYRRYSISYSFSRIQPGDLLLDFFQGSGHQGHVAVVLDGKIILQSYDGNQYMEGGYNGPGMNKRFSASASLSTWRPDVIIRRQNWIDYAGDQTHAAVA